MKRAFLVCLIAGCTAPGGADATDDTGDAEPTATHAVWDGTYRLVSRVDITVEAVLPEQAAEMVATLRALSTNPAGALIDPRHRRRLAGRARPRPGPAPCAGHVRGEPLTAACSRVVL